MGKDYCSFGRWHIRTWTRANRSISIWSNISSQQKTMATGSYTLPHLSSGIDFQWINSINISCSSIKYWRLHWNSVSPKKKSQCYMRQLSSTWGSMKSMCMHKLGCYYPCLHSLIRLYYQYNINHLSACPLTLHALLHLANDIKKNGPPCYNWSFIMEWWCGSLKPAIWSQVSLYTSLAQQQLNIAWENAILAHYGLSEMINGPVINADKPCIQEKVLKDCKWMIFMDLLLLW